MQGEARLPSPLTLSTGPRESRRSKINIYSTGTKAIPQTDRSDDSHDHVRNGRIDESGTVSLRVQDKLHHIGIGRTHRGTQIKMLIHDLNVKVINTATGEILRELTIDLAKHYQPTGKPRRPPRTNK